MTAITVVTPWLECPELAPAYWRAMSVLGEDDRVIVVDNGSKQHVVAPDDERFEVFPLERNIGFSKASNLGLLNVVTEAVAFLNNDVSMTSATWLEQIRQALQPGRLVGAHLRKDAHTAVDGVVRPYLDGWCLAGMTDEILALGGWSEQYREPAYWGDNDLCARATAAGMKLVQAPVGLRHLGNYTSRRMRIEEVSAHNRALYEQTVRAMQVAA